MIDCKYYDKENGWCILSLNWYEAMPSPVFCDEEYKCEKYLKCEPNTKFYICDLCAEEDNQFIVELTYPQYEGAKKIIHEACKNGKYYCGRLSISLEGFQTYEEANAAMVSQEYDYIYN